MVTDPKVTVLGGPIGTLAVGASDSTTFTASYTIDQVDIDAGFVDNLAMVTGTDPGGDPVTDTDPDTVTLPGSPLIVLVKSGTFQDENGDGFADVGETISYSFTVTNTGNVTLTDVMVTDPRVTVSGGPIGTLAVGASDSTTFTASYTIDQVDIDAGFVDNLAMVTGTDPNGDPVTDTDPDTVTLPGSPLIVLVKSGRSRMRTVMGLLMWVRRSPTASR